MNKNFSYAVQKVMLLGEEIARNFSHPLVGSEHILLALIKCGDNLISDELNRLNIKYRTINEKVKNLYKYEEATNGSFDYSLELKEIIEEAATFSLKNKESSISMNSFVFTLINLKNTASDYLISLGVNVKSITNKILDSKRRKSELVGIADLHIMGVDSKDPLIGREEEIKRLIVTLSRRNKPNAILLGEPGVGKTAIVEELAKRLIKDEIPSLKGKTIYELDIASTVSGTKYRGEFEEKLKKIIKKVKDDGNVILFIDEVHNIVKAGGAEGAIDASNILKPYLARADIQMIGATTFEEFNMSFDKDKALKRRFQIIGVKENSLQDTISILKGIKNIYEDFYKIRIEDDVLDYICESSNKYMINQKFPDKAIELLDNSCVCAIDLLTKNDVDETLKEMFNVKSFSSKIEELYKTLISKLFGQEEGIEKIVKAFKEDKKRLIFIGGTGVGKKTACDVISSTLFNEDSLVIDCRDFAEKSPYINYNEKESFCQMINKVRQNPQALIIFKNFESAGREFIKIITTALQKGYFEDKSTNRVMIYNATFVFCVCMTNIDRYSFEIGNKKKSSISQKIKEIFGIEFSLLVDETIYFQDINEKAYEKIVDNYLQEHNIEKKEYDISSVKKERIKYGGNSAVEFAKEIIKNL